MPRPTRPALLASLAIVLAACTSSGPEPGGDPPLLGGAPTPSGFPCVSPAWRAAPAVAPPENASYLQAATSDGTDVWAGGYQLGPESERTLLMRLTVAAWTPDNSFITDGQITSMTSHSGEAWAAGISAAKMMTLRRTGGAWTKVPVPGVKGAGEALLSGISSSGASLWAVGSSDHDDATRTRVYSWNGSAWVTAASPASGTVGRLLSVAGAGRSAWAVGRTENGEPRALVMRFDGRRWRKVSVPATGTLSELNSVTAISEKDVWAGGRFWDAKGAHSLLLHWNGTKWRVVKHPQDGISGQRGGPAPPYGPEIVALHAVGSRDVWAVGLKTLEKNSAELMEQMLVLHWDGRAWSLVEVPKAGEDLSVAQAIVVHGDRSVHVAGYAAGERETAAVVSRSCVF